MKRTVLLIVMAALSLSVFSSCGKDGEEKAEVTAASVWEAISASFQEGFFPEFMELDAASLEKYYNITEDNAEDFLGRIPMMNVFATEILIIKPARGKTDEVAAAIERRQLALDESWREYLPEQYALVQDYRLIESGGWVLFVISKDADKIVEVFTGHTA